MNRPVAFVVLFGVSVFASVELFGQSVLVSSDFDRKFTEILRLHEADRKLNATDIASLKRDVAELKITTCELGDMLQFATANNDRYGTPVSQSLNDRLRDYQNKVQSIAADFGSRLETSDQRTKNELQRAAIQLAGLGKSLAEIKQDIPKLVASMNSNREAFSDEVGLIRLAVTEYSATIEKLCLAVGEQEKRNDEQDRQIQEIRRRIPYEQEPTPAPPLATPQVSPTRAPAQSLPPQRYTPSEIVAEGAPVCKRTLVQAHYDFYAYSLINGVQTVVRYHGNLYWTCQGKLVLVTHVPQ